MNKSFLVLLALVGCAVSDPEVSPNELSAVERLGVEVWADAASDEGGILGLAVAAGDLDGNGQSDFVVGAPWTSNPAVNEGTVSVYSGSASPTLSTTLEANKNRSGFGVSVAIGDVNGDGNADVLVGAPRYESSAAMHDEGAVYLFLGTGGGALASRAAWAYAGGQANARLGRSIVVLGDLDLDGDDEFAVGAPTWDEGKAIDAGMVMKFDGGATPTLAGQVSLGAAGAMEGWALGVAQNFLGDGQTVLATGAIGGGGQVGIYSAANLKSLTVLTTAGTTQFGYALEGADLDGDGEDELVIGDPRADDGAGLIGAGEVHIWSDANGVAVYTRGLKGARFGASVAVGDFEGDGQLDVLVGAPRADGLNAEEGAVYELRNHGDLFAMRDAWSQTGVSADNRLGSELAAGDVDGDGVDDAILGAPGNDNAAVNGGRVSVHLGQLDADGDEDDAVTDCDDSDPLVTHSLTESCLGSLLPVNLGTAEDYVILTKTGISTAGLSEITGNIAVSPAAATYITGFSLAVDPSTEFATSIQVVGSVYAADYSPPTPSKLTTAVSDMETAFTDAAGRPAGVTELGAGNIGGMTLAPGVYSWGTAVLIPTDVTLDGKATDVWIFQIAQDLTLSSGVDVFLSGGALPENVFWQVSGLVDLGTTSHLEGVVLSQTAITLATSASVDGRLLAQTAVVLDDNIVVEP